MEIHDLKTLNMVRPLGIDRDPYFSWIIRSNDQNVMQRAYRILVSKAGGRTVWDTGNVESDQAAFIEYAGSPLESRMLYTWEVTVWDNKGNQASASSEFETALFGAGGWKAKWAESALPSRKRKKGFGLQPPATMFRKTFTLDKEVASARLYATCHGIYRLTVNGERPDDREFAPEFTVYDKYLCYQTYDVTAMLIRGRNALGMYVGDGWYCSRRMKPNIKGLKQLHAVLFQLEIRYTDGSAETVISDEDVRTAYGPVRFSELFSGERYDSNLEMPGWDKPGFDDYGWKWATVVDYGTKNLIAQLGEPVRPVAVLPAVRAFTSPKGESIVDFGQVIAGRVRMRLDAPKGDEITVVHFETLDKDGCFFNSLAGIGGGKGTEQTDVFVSSGGVANYEPFFTFHGFRYILVTGLPEVRAEDFSAVALSSEKEDLGTFSCSDERLTRLYENTRWSQRSNMLSIPTDCPQREKAGWTGDIQIYATTSLLNEDTTAFLTRWLENLECDQYENGGVPFVVPNVGWYPKLAKVAGWQFGNRGPAASAGWGDAAVLVPYFMYHMTGNISILKQQYSSMKRWCDYVINTAAEKRGKNRSIPRDVDRYLWNTGFHFGEWLIPSLTKDGYKPKTLLRAIKQSLQYTAPIYAYCSISGMAEIARILGKTEDVSYYSGMAENIRAAIGDGVIGENGDMPVELMGAYVMPIYFDLVPEKHKEHFAKKLVEMIEKNGGCLDTGFLGTPFILDALCKIGRLDMAYSLLYQEKCPSWLYEVKHGATTIWESWYGYKEDGTPLIISFNHYAFGCVDDWLFRYISGIDKDSPGFKHIIIEPRPDESLTWARRSFKSVHGEIICDWEREGGAFHLEVAIPCNTTATVVLPDGQRHEVGSGRYEFKG